MILQSNESQRAPNAGLRQPEVADGAALHDLVAACPPLDRNSRYCNLLQVSHFAATSVVAESAAGDIVGAVTGYMRPDAPDCLFIWQVAVAPAARGQGLAPRMLGAILDRPACRRVRWLETSITADNEASWATFRRLAGTRDAGLRQELWLARDQHFAGRHADEWLLRIGPFRSHPASPS